MANLARVKCMCQLREDRQAHELVVFGILRISSLHIGFGGKGWQPCKPVHVWV